MKKLTASLAFIALLIVSCNNSQTANNSSSSTSDSVNNSKDWKLGVALWTFHTVNFTESLDKVDSTGLKYIEPNTFHQAGPELRDSLILQLSPAGIDKIKAWIARKGLICASIYIVGDSTIASWKKQ